MRTDRLSPFQVFAELRGKILEVHIVLHRGEKFESMRGAMPFLVAGGALFWYMVPGGGALANYFCSTFQPLSASHTCKPEHFENHNHPAWGFSSVG